MFDRQNAPDTSIFSRIRLALRGYRGLHTGETLILGIRVMTATLDIAPSIPLKTVRKRIGYAAERMHARRVRKVLFSEKFPRTYRELVLGEGFDEMDGSRLPELLAGKIASVFSGHDKVAAFFARRLTGEAEHTFRQLCRDFKYVMTAVEENDGRLYHELCRGLGISVIGHPTDKQLAKADVAVFFSPPARRTVLPEKCVAIPVYPAALDGVVCRRAVAGMAVEPAAGEAPNTPDGFRLMPLIAAAIDAGSLRREDVIVRTLEFRDIYS
ncbi:MAG: hypothetical protein GX936_00390 [Clostridiales bacterium]|nr:hypothetical protein [Clostridiales bacterium]